MIMHVLAYSSLNVEEGSALFNFHVPVTRGLTLSIFITTFLDCQVYEIALLMLKIDDREHSQWTVQCNVLLLDR